MSISEYTFSEFIGASYICEQDSVQQPYSTKPVQQLEDEIDRLRALMVQLSMKEDSLTSELVVSISRMLDEKINEYMEMTKRSR